jgi:hypothetical protein
MAEFSDCLDINALTFVGLHCSMIATWQLKEQWTEAKFGPTANCGACDFGSLFWFSSCVFHYAKCRKFG